MKIMAHQVVPHNALVNWPSIHQVLTQVNGPKVLILGSFNPHNHLNAARNTDYFYGRESNFFWQAIAYIDINRTPANSLHKINIPGGNLNYFQGNLNRKLEAMRLKKFICMDVIDYIVYENENPALVSQFLEDSIFTNFEDSKLFTSAIQKNTYGKSSCLRRSYNLKVFEVIKQHREMKVIHTMGQSRISNTGVSKPLEKSKDLVGFGLYVEMLKQTAGQNFVFSQSPSPSGRAIPSVNSPQFQGLVSWLSTYIP